MAEWRVRGFRIVRYATDHPPRHVHVWRDDRFVGKYDLEHEVWLEGPYHGGSQARRAIEEWRAANPLA